MIAPGRAGPTFRDHPRVGGVLYRVRGATASPGSQADRLPIVYRAHAPIQSLSFLTGRWTGDGYVMEFGAPAGNMLFGSMQAVSEGRTRYWEAFRFSDEGGTLAYHASHLDARTERFPARCVQLAPVPLFVFENPELRSWRRYEFGSDVSGDVLFIAVEGESDESPFRHEWELVRSDLAQRVTPGR